jgi:hypothetical protein
VGDAFEAVFGDEDGDAEVLDEAGDRGEDVFGGGRVECGGRFVEDDDAGGGR